MVDSPHTGVTHIEQAQSQKEVTANEGFDRVSKFVAETRTYTGVAGDVTPTTTSPDFEWQTAVRFVLQGTPGAAIDFNTPASATLRKLFVLDNQLDADVVAQVSGGGGDSATVPQGEARILYSDGVDVFEVAAAGGGGSGGFQGTVAFPRFGGARIERATTNQTIATATDTPISFNAVVFEENGEFVDLGANPTRLTVPAGVTKAVITAGCAWDANATGHRQLFIRKNGTTVLARNNADVDSAIGHQQNVTTGAVDVVAGDYFEAVVFQDSGANRTINAANSTFGSIEVVDVVPRSQVFRGALVKPAANITGQNTTGSTYVVAMDEEVYDLGGWHDNVTNNTRLTVPAGVRRVRLVGQVGISNTTASSWVQAQFFKNGALIPLQIVQRHEISAAVSQIIQVQSSVLEVAQGDYFELQFQNELDTSVDIVAALTWFAVEDADSGSVTALPDGAHATHSTTQSHATSGAWQAVIFDSEDFDTQAFHDTVTNNSRMTVPSGVTHIRLTGRVSFAANATGQRGVRITKNGAVFSQGARILVDATAAGETGLTVTTGMVPVVPGDYFEVEAFQSSGGALNIQDDAHFNLEDVTGVAGMGAPDLILHVVDEKASTTDGGDFTAGSYVARALNTVRTNTIPGASVATNQITLPPGDYEVEASAPAFDVDAHKAKLRDTTAPADLVVGTSSHARSAAGGGQTRSFVRGRFSLTVQSVLELQHRCQTTQATNGLGVNSGFGEVEVYADVLIRRVG